jgi:hypothetical protein
VTLLCSACGVLEGFGVTVDNIGRRFTARTMLAT